jgi:hypothetical protein
MEIGPVEYVIVGFPGNKFKGEIVPELADLVAKGTINVIDFAFVKKDAAGDVTAFELDELPVDEADAFGSFEARIGRLLNEEDLQLAGDSLENDSSAAVLVWENAWAARLAAVVRNADGMLLEHQRVPHEVVQAAIDWAEANG